MRIHLNTLDPASPLAQRIGAALAQDDARRSQVKAAAPSAKSTHARKANDDGSGEVWKREDQLHVAVWRMIQAEAAPGAVIFHVPNGGHRSKAAAGKMKAAGQVPGIPDLIAIVGGKVGGIELKAIKGTLSATQKAMRDRFTRAGAEFEVVRSVTRAREVLRSWGALKGPSS